MSKMLNELQSYDLRSETVVLLLFSLYLNHLTVTSAYIGQHVFILIKEVNYNDITVVLHVVVAVV